MDIQHIYSFTAVFEDGTTIEANHLDEESYKCQTKTDGTGSRFTDVLAKESKLISFVVHNEHQSFGVDLRDGHFEINGVPFFQHRPDLDSYKDFRIIHYRTIRRTKNVQSGEETIEIIGYAVGWQVTHNGKNVKKILFF